MKKIKSWMQSKYAKLTTAATMAAPIILASAGAADTETITTALTTATQTMITDTFSAIAAIVPIVLPLIGASIVIAYVIKFIKRITSKA